MPGQATPSPEELRLRGERNVRSSLRPLTKPGVIQPVIDNPLVLSEAPVELRGAHNKDARRWWRRVVELVGNLPLYRATDGPGLVLLAEALARQERLFRECAGREALPEETDIITGKTLPARVNPVYIAAQKERDAVFKLLDKFGFTPLSRARLMMELMAGKHFNEQAKKTKSEREKVGDKFLRDAGKR